MYYKVEYDTSRVNKYELTEVNATEFLVYLDNIRNDKFTLEAVYDHNIMVFIKFLIKDGGFDSNTSSDIAFDFAKAYGGYEELIKLFYKRNFDLMKNQTIKSYLQNFQVCHKTPLSLLYHHVLYLACKYNSIELVELLLQDKNIDVKHNDDLALKCACRNGNVKIAKLLLNRGADINTTEGYPLYISWRYSHKELLRFLIDSGADKLSDKGIMKDVLEMYETK